MLNLLRTISCLLAIGASRSPVHAVFESITRLKNLDLPPITTYICIDNKAAIGPLQNNKHSSGYARLAALMAPSLRTNGWNFYIAWTPAHQNILVNELADQMAKRGVTNTNDMCVCNHLIFANYKKAY
jgi:ribonuclease HI